MKRFLTAFVILASAAGLAALGDVVYAAGVAAGAGSSPVPVTSAAVDTTLDLLRTDGPLWAGVLFAYVGLRTFISRQHWLAQGRVLATLTGLSMILAAVVAWHFEGAPSSGIITAVIAAIALVQHPTVPPKPTSGGTTGGVLAAALLALLAACATLRPAAGSGAATALNCELAHLDAQLLADATKLADAAVRHWIGGAGKPSAELQAAIRADLEPFRSDLGRCAIAGAVDALAELTTTARTATPGLAVPDTSIADVAALRAAFSAAAREAGWAPVQIAGGAVL